MSRRFSPSVIFGISKRIIEVILTIAIVGVAAISVLQLFGGLFFGYSFWYFVPPICTLAMLPSATIQRTDSRLLVAYSLFVLLILSYVSRNWRDVELAAAESFWLVIIPHGMHLTLCLSVLIWVHLRR
jgi:hypothetical protein